MRPLSHPPVLLAAVLMLSPLALRALRFGRSSVKYKESPYLVPFSFQFPPFSPPEQVDVPSGVTLFSPAFCRYFKDFVSFQDRFLSLFFPPSRKLFKFGAYPFLRLPFSVFETLRGHGPR